MIKNQAKSATPTDFRNFILFFGSENKCFELPHDKKELENGKIQLVSGPISENDDRVSELGGPYCPQLT